MAGFTSEYLAGFNRNPHLTFDPLRLGRQRRTGGRGTGLVIFGLIVLAMVLRAMIAA